MDVFKGQNFIEFAEPFKTDENCKEYLSVLKWENGYTCRKCGHKRVKSVRIFQEHVTFICSDTKSSTANTLFHKVKFGLRKAFFICFEMGTTTKSLSAMQMGVRCGVQESTARLFMHQVRGAIKSSGNNPIDGIVYVDEFVVGGYEEYQQGRSYDSKKKVRLCSRINPRRESETIFRQNHSERYSRITSVKKQK